MRSIRKMSLASQRIVASVVAFLFIATTLVAGINVPGAAAASPELVLSSDVTGSILAGDGATVNLSAQNQSASTTNLYNLSFSTELPTGVTYAGGSTTPSTIGDPRIITVVVTPDPLFPLVTVSHQVLVWSNVSDLVIGNSSGLSFKVNANPTTYPVGSDFGVVTHAYANNDPRYLPKFNSTTGTAIAGPTSYTSSDTVSPANTNVSAIKITKSNPNPESELMRGIHNQTSTFTLRTTNTNQAATNDVRIVDYLPAEIEFLGCGATDNSSAREYTGAASLTATPVPANCATPYSVDTVLNPAGYPAGVYTRIEWRIGDLAAGANRNITYAVGIPLYANTMTFSGTAPTALSLGQTANLNNNNGASTRHIDDAASYKNSVTASGTYTGAVKVGTSTTATSSASNTVRSMDLDVVETASTGTFVSNTVFTYDMMVRTSEYVSADTIVLTDLVPNGICPIVPVGTTIIGTMPADCQPSASGTVTGGTITSVTVNSDGTFLMTFAVTPATLVKNTTTHVVYTAMFRGNYEGGLIDPTASGDSFSNRANITGESYAVPATAITPVQQHVKDGSGTTQSSSAPTIIKSILPRTTINSTAECLANAGNYVIPNGTTVPNPNFVLGDRICFELQINFSTTTDTRNAKVTDFVPVGTTYEGFAVGTSTQGATIPTGDVTGGTPTASWSFGHQVGADTTNKFVDKGKVAVLYVSAIVTDPSTNAAAVDITANLMKYTQQNTAGTVFALRTQADFGIAPAPTVTLTKGISNLNGTANVTPYPTSGSIVGSQYADFSLTAANTGTALIGNNQPVTNPVIWDALPLPVTCADVSNITPAGVCTDNYTGLTGTHAGQSAIVWTLNETVAAGANSSAMTYRVTFPATGMSVSTDFINDASVVAFNIDSTAPSDTTFYPTDSLDTAHTSSWNTTAANANAKVTTPNVTVAKTLVSPVVAPNNTAANAVAGELVDYTYSVTIPAHTTIYNGRLQDNLPTGLVKLAGTSTTTTVPNGVTTYTGTTYSTAFDATYTNTTNAAQTFSTTITGVQVAPGTALTNIANTATFKSDSKVTGGVALTDRTANANLPVIKPTPTIAKVVALTSGATGTASVNAVAGQSVYFTLTANNGTTSPAGYDTVINDCLPNGLTFDSDITLPVGVTRAAPVAGTGTGAGQNGCATTTRLIQYTLGTLAPNTPVVIKFSATVDPSSAGLAAYANTARVITSTLNDGVRDATVEGVITSSAGTGTVNVAGGAITKTTTKSTATIGETVPYVITATIPANINFYNAAIIDTVPAGILLDQTSTVITCTVAVTNADCMSDLPSGGSTMTATSTKSGWYLGTITSSSAIRTIKITVNSTVRSIVGNVIGGTLTNTAQLSWNDVSGAAPANAGSTFVKSTTVNGGSTAVTTIQEPALTIGKTNTNANPAPGATFGYSVKVTNANNTNTSTAYNVTVTDTIPAGVVVDAASVSNGGTITGATVNGGGTITWTGLTIAKNVTLDLTYTAVLAPSTALSANTTTHVGSTLTNTAKVTTYASLPSGGRTYTAAPTATSVVNPIFPHVSLAKVPNAGTVAYANQPFAWKLTMTNGAAAGTATTVTPTDVLPKNWTYVVGSAYITAPGTGTVTQVDPVSSTIVAGVQTLVWAPIGSFAAGNSAVIIYNATPSTAALGDPGIGQTHAHTNTLSAVTTDAAGYNQNSSESYTTPAVSADAFIGSADIQVVKANAGTLVAGNGATNAWTIIVKNNGSDTAVGQFTVTDDLVSLPAGITISQPTGTGWSCTVPVAGDFTCTRTNANDTLASGVSFPTITVQATVAANVVAGTTMKNDVAVAAITTDPNLANNVSTATQTVTTSSDLSVVKTTSGTLFAGQTATWTIVVNNDGPSLSHSPVTVTDTLPAGLTGAVASGTGWTCAPVVGGVITCTMGDLTGAAPTITVTGSIPSDFTGTMVNTAVVSGTETDPTPLNNTSGTSDVVNTDTAITLQKTLTTSTGIVPGATATYRLDVHNDGLADARNVTISDALPNGLTFDGSVVSITTGWTCSEVSTSPSTVECELTGTLAPGATGSVSFNVAIPSSLPLTTNVVNVATAHADNAADSTDDAQGSPAGISDLAVTKTHPAGTINAGDDITYTIGVQNKGTTDNNGAITVTDTLPAGISLVSATGTDWVCTPDGSNAQVVDCVWATGLTNGAYANDITIVAHVAASVLPSTLTNNVTVAGTSDYSDPDLSNNSANDPAVITTLSDVTIDKTGDAVLVPGTDTSYTITIVNNGPSNAANAKVVDVLPAGLTGVSIAGAGWTCTLATLTCVDGDLEVGTSTITVVAHVSSNVATNTALVNEATVTWAGTGINSGTDDATGTAAASADIKLTKTAHDLNVMAGNSTKFDLSVENLGSSDAVGDITITDTLPAGMSFVGATSAAGAWTCAPDSTDPQLVECVLNAGIPAGGTAVLLTIEVQLDSSLPPSTLTNTATATSPTDDPDLTNNTDTASVDVDQEVDITVVEALVSGTPRIGNTLRFGYTVHNDGPSDAKNVVVTVKMPVGLDAIDAVGSNPDWTCVVGTPDATGTEVVCTLNGDLVAGDDAPTLVLNSTVGVAAYPTFTNNVKVTTTTPETDYDNNADALTLPVPPLVGLNIDKQHVGTIQAGEQAHYVITIKNEGLTEAPNGFTVVDTLPAGMAYKSFTGTGVTCTVVGNVVTCEFTDVLAVGASASVDIYVDIALNATGTLTNTAVVSTPDENESTSVVTASDTGSILPPDPSKLAYTGTTFLLWALLGGIAAALFGALLLALRRRFEGRIAE